MVTIDTSLTRALTAAEQHRQQGRPAQAAEICQSVLVSDPTCNYARLVLAASLKAMLRLEEAARQYELAIQANPSLSAAHNNLGNIYEDLLQHEAAERCFLKALELQPGAALTLQNLGGVYSEQGRAAEAIDAYRQALRIKPDYAKAHHHLAFTKRHDQIDDDVKAMERLYASARLSPDDSCHLAFGLGKAYDDLGLYQKAFGYFAEGNRLKHQLDNHPLVHTLRLIEALRGMRYNFPPARTLPDRLGDPIPIFLVGMPRSGTSLTEQILANHSMVHAMGELPTLGALLFSSAGNFPHGLLQLNHDAWRQLGWKYLDQVRRLSNGAAFITDKMPSNFMYTGFIRLMLPQAIIVDCRRNALDTCLSCFKSYFVDRRLAYTGNLVEIGTYYQHYRSLMEYWHQQLPGWITTTSYEDLTSKPQQTIGRLLKACGLSLEEDCLQFHGSERTVATASALQIRQPIHGRSIQAWKHYANELQPLRAIVSEDQ
jgi:tetratricopeptide (TPR) repeat protein